MKPGEIKYFPSLKAMDAWIAADKDKAKLAGSIEIVEKSVRKSVLTEAEGLVHGDRNNSYGHPLDCCDRVAGMVNAMLSDKLSKPLVGEDVAAILCCLKIARQYASEKRDNLVDLAGYAEVWQWIVDEREDRDAKNS